MKFLYLCATGPGDPTRASLPFHIAVNGSVEVGHDTSVVLVGDGVEMVIGDNPETVEGVGVPPMRELLAKVREHGVPVYV